MAQAMLPNQIDLTAAYCSGVFKKQIEKADTFRKELLESIGPVTPFLKEGRSEKLDRIHADYRRIQLYLVPRIPNLYADGLLAAMQSGQEDEDRAYRERLSCAERKKCLDAKLNECMDSCDVESPAFKRISRCIGTNFLPM